MSDDRTTDLRIEGRAVPTGQHIPSRTSSGTEIRQIEYDVQVIAHLTDRPEDDIIYTSRTYWAFDAEEMRAWLQSTCEEAKTHAENVLRRWGEAIEVTL